MSRATPKDSDAQRERSRAIFLKRYETSAGKNDILRTWELQGREICAEHQRYLVGLSKRIRQQRNLLSHMRPQWDE